jgi:hypothetical protein
MMPSYWTTTFSPLFISSPHFLHRTIGITTACVGTRPFLHIPQHIYLFNSKFITNRGCLLLPGHRRKTASSLVISLFRFGGALASSATRKASDREGATADTWEPSWCSVPSTIRSALSVMICDGTPTYLIITNGFRAIQR